MWKTLAKAADEQTDRRSGTALGGSFLGLGGLLLGFGLNGLALRRAGHFWLLPDPKRGDMRFSISCDVFSFLPKTEISGCVDSLIFH